MTTFSIPFVPAAPRTGFGRILKATKAARMRHETKRALSQLDDHMLRDIGVTPPPRFDTYDLMRKARASW